MIERTIKVELTPNELAFCFCNMSSTGQAMFFNEIAVLTQKWDRPFPFQLEALSLESILTKDGRVVMEEIGSYAQQGNIDVCRITCRRSIKR